MLLMLSSISAGAWQLPDSPSATTAQAATQAVEAPAAEPTAPANESHFFLHLAADQKEIFTSPLRLQPAAAKWILPFGGITAGLLATDADSSWAMLSHSPATYRSIADYGLLAAIGGAGGSYVWGHLTHNEHARETGLLAAEAMIDVLPMQYLTQYTTGRLRPTQSDFQNVFFHGGDSFPSNHAAVTWAFASVVAHEYPNPLIQVAAYGLATGVSLARVRSGDHFLSDVWVGGLLGYQAGRQVYRQRHNPEFDPYDLVSTKTGPDPDALASTYVSLDSWIYPAMAQLIARGLLPTAYLDLRPWTRLTCARLLTEINTQPETTEAVPPDLEEIKHALDSEFADEVSALKGQPYEAIRLESVYSQVTGIAGPPLNQNNFGQTVINNYGRPYQEGVNAFNGFSARAEDGRFAFYVSGEYQHAPAAPPLPLLARQTLALVNLTPVPPDTPTAATNRFCLLDTYVMTKFLGSDISVGKESLYWGPTQSGAMLISNNAEPFWMLRMARAKPVRVPLLSTLFGPAEFDNFFGMLSGHNLYPQGPFMYGNKISLKPTQNIELSIARTTIFAGQGHVPLTFGSFWNSFISFSNVPYKQKISRNDPGARHSSFDITYRVPKLRDWLTIYFDSVVHDNQTPLESPQRAGWNPGIYLNHFPKLSKLDLRLEAVSTDPPVSGSHGGQFLYWEYVYQNLYLNNDNLMGSWIGREGKGYQAWATYHFSPRTSLQLGYRNAKIAKDYIPQGTTQQDVNITAIVHARPNLSISAFAQFESWLVPVINPNRQQDFLTSVQLTYWPKMAWKRPTE